jgi:phenylalanine ammonia-lyase
LTIDGSRLKIGEIAAIGTFACEIELADAPLQRDRMRAAAQLVEHAVEEGWSVYGVTTGFGGMAHVPVPGELAVASQNNLLAFLAAGAGPPIDYRHVRGAMALRANVLMQGYSGVGRGIVERLVRFLNAGATPVVRELGSIGASGDLIPLATIGRAITGQTNFVKVHINGRVVDGLTALREIGLEPMKLAPKEGLAIVNGTSFSSAVAANCVAESRGLMALALGAQALMLRALNAEDEPFEPFVHQRKPHPGQIWCAQMTLRLLNEGRRPPKHGSSGRNGDASIQDRYSLRCLPQYMGPIVEGLARISQVVETEMNAVSDNPLVDVEAARFYQSGNFLGQYVGIAMDDLRRFIGLLAKHLDVQIASLVAPPFSNGLPSSLCGNRARSYNMGLKGLQITGNSIMPMLTYFGNPIVEHFPTHAEQFNQNINGLSWGAANLAWKSVELFRHYLSVALIFGVQALDLRAKSTLGHYDGSALLGTLLMPLYEAVSAATGIEPGKQRPFLFNDDDQWLEQQLADLQHNLAAHDTVLRAIDPVLQSFDEQVQQA